MAKRRDWSRVAQKMAGEPGCRVCGRTPFEYAHVIGRTHDGPVVNPDDIVPLCGPTPGGCHGAYDGHTLDLLPYLHLDELLRAIQLVGEEQAAIRIRSSRSPQSLRPRITELKRLAMGHRHRLPQIRSLRRD